MEARFTRVISTLALLVCICLSPIGRQTEAAGYRTTNFVVSAPTPELAKEIGDQAEVYRRQLAIEWIGKELPAWSEPCPIHAQVGPSLGAGGATSFVFDRGEVFGWKMNIQGSRQRILDSVLPHEVTHTIFASYFRQPLPRWADEGACTTVEHPSEVAKQQRNLIEFLKTGRGIPFSQMFAMKEYPQDVMPLYAQGYSLSEWLIENRGRKEFISFVGDGMQDDNWPRAVREHYGFPSLLALQNAWNDWVRQGRPHITPATSAFGQIASNSPNNRAIYRGQSPDDVTPIGATPPSRSDTPTSVIVASASQSVYAAAAQRAQRDRSVYDASRGDTALRR
ncbi:MAG TPA: hypothetical protein VHE81_05590 [Lacipirellulaceae bacterium]|nr:hypothetical protein [Lacipirellulaceae bacterium]